MKLPPASVHQRLRRKALGSMKLRSPLRHSGTLSPPGPLLKRRLPHMRLAARARLMAQVRKYSLWLPFSRRVNGAARLLHRQRSTTNRRLLGGQRLRPEPRRLSRPV